MDLVTDHMLESLIEGGAQENQKLLYLPSEAIVHPLISISLVTQSVKFS